MNNIRHLQNYNLYCAKKINIDYLLHFVAWLCFLFLFVNHLSLSIFFISFYIILLLIRPGIKTKAIFNLIYLLGNIFAFLLFLFYQKKYGMEFPYYQGGSDDLSYENSAKQFIKSYSYLEYSQVKGGVVSIYHNSPGYIFIVSLLMRVSNLIESYHTFIPRLFNIFILSCSSIIAYKISRVHVRLGVKHASIIALFVGLSPLMLYVSSHIYRDIIVSFLFLLIIYHSFSKIKFISFLVIILAVLITTQLRMMTALFMVAVFFAIKIYMTKNQLLRTSGALLFSCIFVAVFSYAEIFEKLLYFAAIYSEYRIELSSGLAANIFNIPLPLGMPFRALYYLVTPIPQVTIEFDRFMLTVGVLFQLIFSPFLLITIFYCFVNKSKNKEAFVICSIFLLLWLGLSAVVFSTRQMVMFYPFAIIIIVYGFSENIFVRKFKKIIFTCGLLTCSTLLPLYSLVKAVQ